MALLVGAALGAEAADATPAVKQPWTWTTEQRLAARFDAAAIRERMAAYEGRLTPDQRAAVSGPSTSDIQQYVIEGTRNPELFLPSELIRGLLDAGLTSDAELRAMNRPLYRPGIVALGIMEDEFWELLSASTDRQHLSRQTADPELARCRTNKYVLDAMRARFGRENFDRFLYVTVARYSAISSASNDTRREKEDLRREEMGCPE